MSLYWHIPLDILVVGWCFRRRGLDVRSRQFLLALLVALLAALFNVYYAALFVQFLGLSALAQVARRSPRRALAPLLLAAAVVALFALESLGTLRYPREHGSNLAAVSRSYGDLERYALKPIELVLPLPGHGLLGYGDLAKNGYWQNARGEIGSAYLGLAAIAGVASLLTMPVIALLMRRRIFITPALGALVWIAAFSVAGGINGVLGSLGVVLFRGTNRYSIWMAALGLLALGGRLSRSAAVRRSAGALAPLLLAVLVLLDQTPGILSRAGVAAQFQQLQKDRAFAERIEASLPGRPMIYMLPVLDFPEGGSVRGMPDYDHFRSYLFTSRVRYSYGTDKGRAREEWQRRVEAMAPAEDGRAPRGLRILRHSRRPSGLRRRQASTCSRASPKPDGRSWWTNPGAVAPSCASSRGPARGSPSRRRDWPRAGSGARKPKDSGPNPKRPNGSSTTPASLPSPFS